jgi:uncharacterized protein (DUF58 family)
VKSRIVFILWLISAAAAFGTNRQLFYQIWYLLTALIAFAFVWSWTSLRWLDVERKTPATRSQVGKIAEEHFAVYNRAPFPKLWLEVIDHSTLPGHVASRVVSSLGRKQSRTWSVKTRCLQRGRYLLGPLTLQSGDPFGLFPRRRALPQLGERSFIVYPAIIDLPFFAPLMGPLSGGESMHRRTHFVTTNVAGIRDYVPGDSFNRIHWPSTARTNRLISKEFELDPTADVWLFLDLDRSVQLECEPPEQEPELTGLPWERSYRLRLTPSTVEYAVTILASLAKHFTDQDQAVGLIGYSRHREVIPADRGERQLTKMLELLAVIQAEGRIPMSDVLTAEGTHLGRNTTAVVVTPTGDERTIMAAYDLQRRGVKVVAIILDAESFGSSLSNAHVPARLAAAGILTYIVREGDDLAHALMSAPGRVFGPEVLREA